MVCQLHLADLAVVVHGNKGEDGSFQFVFRSRETAVADTVTAFVAVKLRLGRFPARIPDIAVLPYVKIFSVDVAWNVVVAVARHAKKFRILIEGIAAAGVGN